MPRALSCSVSRSPVWRCISLFLAIAALAAMEIPPPPDPEGLGERLSMLEYLRERGVKARSGLDEGAVRQLYEETWQVDPANGPRLAILLRDEAAQQRVDTLRAAIIQHFGIQPDPALDADALQTLQIRLEGERLEQLADRAREAAARGEMELQRVRFTDGGTLLGLYDATTHHIEVHDEKTGKRIGEVALNLTSIASVVNVTIRITPPAAAEPAAGGAQAGCDGAWITDAASARRLAAAEHRPVLILFTGSDWCTWCQKLDQEVFSTPHFKSWAAAKVVLLYVDFPRKKPLDAKQAGANQALQQQYGVRGFPTVLFTDADGRQLGEFGYQKGDAQAWTTVCDGILAAKP